jgi:hypothetical protein
MLGAQGRRGVNDVAGSRRTTALRARGRRGSITSQARGGRQCCGLGDGAGLTTSPAWGG